MNNILLYTFRTFPWMDQLSDSNIKLFVFGRLKEDLPKFLKLVDKTHPDTIIGIAKSANGISRFETKAINVFNKNKKISKTGEEYYFLDYPKMGFKNIGLNNSYTDSFCNCTMYKISENTKTKLQFIHIAKADVGELREHLNLHKEREGAFDQEGEQADDRLHDGGQN